MKTLLLILAITCGILIPQAHILSFLIQYNLMVLLIFAFLNLKPNRSIIKKAHFYILAANLIIPFAFYFMLKGIDTGLALTAFITAIAPTAIAGPAVIHQLQKKVEFTAFSVLLTNLVIALLMPFILPFVLSVQADMPVASILLPMLIVLFAPMIAVLLLRWFWNSAIMWLDDKKEITYYLLLLSVFLAVSKATHFITMEYTGPKHIIIFIALITIIICAVSFYTGKKLGGKDYAQESMQSLGQKNNSLTLWIALTFINPLTALGPVFYIICHNVVISYQLYRHNKSEHQIV